MLLFLSILFANIGVLLWPQGVFDTPLAMMTLMMIWKILCATGCFFLSANLLNISFSWHRERFWKNWSAPYAMNLTLAAFVFAGSFLAIMWLSRNESFDSKVSLALMCSLLLSRAIQICYSYVLFKESDSLKASETKPKSDRDRFSYRVIVQLWVSKKLWQWLVDDELYYNWDMTWYKAEGGYVLTMSHTDVTLLSCMDVTTAPDSVRQELEALKQEAKSKILALNSVMLWRSESKNG